MVERETTGGRGGGGQDGGGRRLMPAGRVLVAMLVCLLVAALLAAHTLERRARALPFGATRSVAVAFAVPLRAVSSFLFLDRPAVRVDAWLGRGDEANGVPGPGGNAAERPLPGSPASPRTLAPGHKLVLWVGGDSMAQVFGESLVNMAMATKAISPTLDYHISTGLTRPDYYDWPLHLRYVLDSLDPDAVVAVFGANDTQDMKVGGRVLEQDSPEWLRAYRERVAQAMDIVATAGRRVYWVGQPVMRLSLYNRHIAAVNAVFREEARRHPFVTYVDAWSLFADSRGGYAPYLRDAEGELQAMRQADGIHLTRAGGDRLAKAVLELVERDFSIGG